MNKIYFSKVFKGYSPEEVEAFIIKLNTDFQQKQQEFAAETKRLNNEIEEQKLRFEETLSANERLVIENRELVAANEQLAQANHALDELVKQLNEEKQNLLKEIKVLEDKKISELSAAVAPEERNEFGKFVEDVLVIPEETVAQKNAPEENMPQESASEVEAPEVVSAESFKSEDYRRLCEQMGEKLLIADKRAQEIINEARVEADKILENAIEGANVEVKKLIAEAKSKAETVKNIVDEYEKKQVFISAGLEQARKHISEAIGEVEALIVSKKNEKN